MKDKIKLEGETFIHNLYRYISWQLILRFLAKTDITPNQITIFRTLLTIISLFCFLAMKPMLYVIGFIIFQIAETLDSTDGDLARYKDLKSKMGVFLEIFFDSIITPVWGLLGLVFAYIGYTVDGDFIYFVIWGLIGFSNNLEKTFYIHFVGEKSSLREAEHGHIYFGFKNETFFVKIRNFIIVSKSWENQWLIFGGLLYLLLDLNLFLYIWIWIFLLNQIHWTRIAYQGFKDAKNHS